MIASAASISATLAMSPSIGSTVSRSPTAVAPTASSASTVLLQRGAGAGQDLGLHLRDLGLVDHQAGLAISPVPSVPMALSTR